MTTTAPNDVTSGEEPPGEYRRPWSDSCAYEEIPPNLDSMLPGPALAGFLSSINVSEVSPHNQVIVLRANDRMMSHFTAQRYRDIAAVHRTYTSKEGISYSEAGAASAAEVRLALHLTRRGADTELALALSLERRLPRLFDMLVTGTIDIRRARVIERETVHLQDGTAQDVLDRIAPVAPDLTTGQLGAQIRKLCIEADPAEARDRYETAHAERRIVTQPTDSGTVNLMGYDLPPDEVAAIMGKVNSAAISLHGTQEENRTMDQLRADICLDLLRGGVPAGGTGASNTGVIELLVDLETLAGLTEHPGDLGGYGPVIADVARKIADEHHDADWRITIIDSHGDQAHMGTTARRPTVAQRRQLQTRHRTCAFPGCRMPARVCDLDHTTAVQDGGETCNCNLAPLCRHDHRIKHMQGWDYRLLPDGRPTWTTPLGHRYTTATNRAPPDR